MVNTSDSGSRGRWFEPHSGRRVVSLSKTYLPPKSTGNIYPPPPKKKKKYSLNVTTSGRNCNTIFDVLTSKMPNADRPKYAFMWGDFVLIKPEHENKYDKENCNLWPVIP